MSDRQKLTCAVILGRPQEAVVLHLAEPAAKRLLTLLDAAAGAEGEAAGIGSSVRLRLVSCRTA
jgi:hypothetical protein